MAQGSTVRRNQTKNDSFILLRVRVATQSTKVKSNLIEINRVDRRTRVTKGICAIVKDCKSHLLLISEFVFLSTDCRDIIIHLSLVSNVIMILDIAMQEAAAKRTHGSIVCDTTNETKCLDPKYPRFIIRPKTISVSAYLNDPEFLYRK